MVTVADMAVVNEGRDRGTAPDLALGAFAARLARFRRLGTQLASYHHAGVQACRLFGHDLRQY